MKGLMIKVNGCYSVLIHKSFFFLLAYRVLKPFSDTLIFKFFCQTLFGRTIISISKKDRASKPMHLSYSSTRHL